MIGTLLNLVTLRRFYAVPKPTEVVTATGPREHGPTGMITSPLDPNREASDLAQQVAKALKMCDRLALAAMEDTIFLMERMYIEQFGQEPYNELATRLTVIKGRLGRIYDVDDQERYDDSVLVDRIFERYDNILRALDRDGDLLPYNKADTDDPVALLKEVEGLATYLACRGLAIRPV